MSTPIKEVDVFVAGAGPTGLTAANEAIRHGLTVHIIDSKPHRSTYSKALVVHARTLEVFEGMGLVKAIRKAGVPFAAMRLKPGLNSDILRVSLMDLQWGDTRYPYWLSIPQYETERCLEEHLEHQGVQVQWNTSFLSYEARKDSVEVTVVSEDGTEQVYRAKWLIGCDGGRSRVREQAGIIFDRENIGETFVLADVLGETPFPEDEGTTSLTQKGVLFLVPMPEPKRWRIIAHMPNLPEKERVTIDTPFVNTLLAERIGVDFEARDITWSSQFVLQQGVAQNYRTGRVFIAGDAAHLHSPVGGQGLNTGVQDAAALLWRIALAERSEPKHDALLDSYTDERRAIAASMVKRTTQATSLMTLRNRMGSGIRNFIARRAFKLSRVQNKLGRGVGMLDTNCKASPIIRSESKQTTTGNRLPNPISKNVWLHDLLHNKRHTVLILDPDGASLTAELRASGIACIQIVKNTAEEGFADEQGILNDAFGGAKLVIVRPDRIVATTATKLSSSVVFHYAQDILGVSPQAI